MREIRTSGSTRGGWVVFSDIAHSPTLLTLWQDNLDDTSTHYHPPLTGCDWRELIFFWYRRVIMKVRIVCLLILCLPVVSAQFSAYGQTHRGSIRGTVVNRSGEAISNAAIKLVQEETNESRIVRADDQGEFTVAALPAGQYR